jgi:hypothetical protein
MEDFSAVHAAVEAGIKEWIVIRSITDLAYEIIPGESATPGVPWDERFDQGYCDFTPGYCNWIPDQPFKWHDENDTWGYFSDYTYFYRIPYLVLKQIVQDWGLDG